MESETQLLHSNTQQNTPVL